MDEKELMLYAVSNLKREVSRRCRDMLRQSTGSFTIDEYFEKSGSYIKGVCEGISLMCNEAENSNIIEGKLYQSFIDELIVSYGMAKKYSENN